MNPKRSLSAVILTKNEEKNIVDCLDSLSWVDQIIVLDDFSEDRTIEVIRTLSYKDKILIYKRRLDGDFSEQRNYAMTKVKTEWILFVDSDERVTDELKAEINDLLILERNFKKNSGFYLRRLDVMWGKLINHGESGGIS